MAANFSGLPAAAPSTTSEQSTTNALPNKPVPTNAVQCSCSNISIMQLFHEMKQEFPTVPDHVVTQLVAENCHNRPRCVEKLSEVEEEYALSTQAYPVQSIRNNKPPTPPRRCKNVQRQLEQEKLKDNRDKSVERNKINNISKTHVNNNQDKSDESSCEVILKNHLKESMCKFDNKTINKHNEGNVTPLVYTRPAPQRPTTLLINKTPENRVTPRPIRSAPPPPISAGMTVLSSNPNAAPESLNVSLNVTVSPVSGRPPHHPRHISEVTVQPEMPYSPPIAPHSSAARSYTSVNFTLRPPCSTNAQSPIDISAGPNLTYSSSSYDARQGYQSSLQITVGNTGAPAMFSAMRTRAQQIYENNNVSNINNNSSGCGDNRMVVQEYSDLGMEYGEDMYQQQFYPAQPKRPNPISSSTMYNPLYGLLGSNSCQLMSSSLREDEIVQRQLSRKRALENELHRDKYRLEIMQYDIRVFEMSFPLSETARLTEEIRLLQNECKMLSEILDKAGVAVLGDLPSSVNALSLNSRDQILSSNNNNSSSSIRSPKPPRPPLPAALRTVTSPQRALQMPAFTSLQQLNLQQNPSIFSTTTGYNPDDFQSNNNNVSSWTCGVCTFQNHPLLNKCEQCEEPRIPSGTIQITAAHFEPRFENVQYQQQALTNPDTANAKSFSMTNDTINNGTLVQESTLVPLNQEFPSNINHSSNNKPIVSTLDELQFENVTQEEHTYVNVGSMSLGNIPRILENQRQRDVGVKLFVKGHRYTPSM